MYQPPIFIYDFSDFLYDDALKDTKWLTKIKTELDKKDLIKIASGGVGAIYENKYKKNSGWVIKKIDLCNRPISTNCIIAQDQTLIYKYNGTDYSVVLMPSIMIEMLACKKISQLFNTKVLFGVPEINRYADDFPNAVYIESKKYFNLPIKNLREDEIALLIVQAMSCLVLMQKNLAFTHYDLHWGNIMSAPLNTLIASGEVCLELQENIAMKFKSKNFPIIIDYGTCTFSESKKGDNIIYINTTNASKKYDPRKTMLFNQYFDYLTLIKSLQLHGYILENFPNILSAFFKDPQNYSKFYDGPTSDIYKPNINKIKDHESELLTPVDIILNLVNKFYPSSNLFKKELDICTDGAWNILNPIIPLIADPTIIPDFPFTVQKKYFMDFGAQGGVYDANIKVLREVENTKIFAFALFATDKVMKNAYKYFYDPSYNLIRTKGKNDDSIFYHNYLGNQLAGCVSLINNTEITPFSEGDGSNQWSDFGTLILIDEHALNMPMFVQIPNSTVFAPWKKGTDLGAYYSSIKSDIMKDLTKTHSIDVLLKKYNVGTVKEYIYEYLIKTLDEEHRSRFGVYSYKLDAKFDIDIDLGVNSKNIKVPKIKNTVNFIGTVARYYVLQDPEFEVVLFRDAHSTLPNRNYKYDRSWYETWINAANKRFWIYHGAFYNPVHFNNVKSGFAATWGARKPDGFPSILKVEEYSEIFGHTNIDPTLFYEAPTYGIDERLLYRMYKDPKYMKHAYLVGFTHFMYLWKGQENPRMYKTLKYYDDSPENHHNGANTKFETLKLTKKNLDGVTVGMNFRDIKLETDIVKKGGIVTSFDPANVVKNIHIMIMHDITDPIPKQLQASGVPTRNEAEFRDEFLTESPWMCRPNQFIMPSLSFYTDMRCVVLNFIDLVAKVLNKSTDQVTIKEFFDAVDVSLRSPLPDNPQEYYAYKLQRMIPPRWNIWQYIFGMEYLDGGVLINQYIDAHSKEGDVFLNTRTVCKINRKLWIGNNFNFDKYFFGDPSDPTNIDLPDNSVLPQNYPYVD